MTKKTTQLEALPTLLKEIETLFYRSVELFSSISKGQRLSPTSGKQSKGYCGDEFLRQLFGKIFKKNALASLGGV